MIAEKKLALVSLTLPFLAFAILVSYSICDLTFNIKLSMHSWLGYLLPQLISRHITTQWGYIVFHALLIKFNDNYVNFSTDSNAIRNHNLLLVASVSDNATPNNVSYIVDEDRIVHRISLLQRFLDRRLDREIQALCALQALMHSLEHPPSKQHFVGFFVLLWANITLHHVNSVAGSFYFSRHVN